ncbi:hypothetical protein, partial [Schnuerera sp.]|uniref:hypothetical protein n=1 Tax=Schnuerera sp. TaxID=2794844 RepID=UPI002C0EE4C6
QWQGPFTYEPKTASVYRGNYYGVVDNKATEFNNGNTFGGESYDTVIESVANVANAPHITKLFRKFYLETEGDATFSYAKNYGDWTDKILSNYPTKNGLTHIGVNPANKNGRQIYWKIVSNIQDFILQQVSWLYEPRKRR